MNITLFMGAPLAEARAVDRIRPLGPLGEMTVLRFGPKAKRKQGSAAEAQPSILCASVLDACTCVYVHICV